MERRLILDTLGSSLMAPYVCRVARDTSSVCGERGGSCRSRPVVGCFLGLLLIIGVTLVCWVDIICSDDNALDC